MSVSGGIGLWIAFAALYVLLAGEISLVESTSAAVAATLATALAVSTNRTAHRHFQFRLPFRVLLRPALALGPETFRVGRMLIRAIVAEPADPGGGLVVQPFARGDEVAAAAGRRAAVVLALSFAPQTFVVREEAEGGLLVHGLPPKPVAQDRAWPL